MANLKTSEEADAGTLDGTEEVRLAIAGQNYRTTTRQIAALALALGLIAPPLVTPYTGSHTLGLADAPAASLNQGIATFNSAAAVVVTVPAHSAVAWVPGTIIQLIQLGAGQITVAASGNTILNAASLTSRAQNSALLLTYLGGDVWSLSGDMT
jgi:hypothetical protein